MKLINLLLSVTFVVMFVFYDSAVYADDAAVDNVG